MLVFTRTAMLTPPNPQIPWVFCGPARNGEPTPARPVPSHILKATVMDRPEAKHPKTHAGGGGGRKKKLEPKPKQKKFAALIDEILFLPPPLRYVAATCLSFPSGRPARFCPSSHSPTTVQKAWSNPQRLTLLPNPIFDDIN